MPTPEQMVVSLVEQGAMAEYQSKIMRILVDVIRVTKSLNDDFGPTTKPSHGAVNYNPFQTELILQQMRNLATNKRSTVAANLLKCGCTPEIIRGVELKYRDEK